MHHRVVPAWKTRLPTPPDGWFDIAYAVTVDGELACFRATTDVRAAWARRYAELDRALSSGDAHPPPFSIPSDTLAMIEVIGRDEARGTFTLETPFPLFDRLSDGAWIVAEARCLSDHTNARVIAADGSVLRRIRLGDGIEDLQCDANGKIWVSYFDEGVCGDDTVSSSGLNRFNNDGSIDWRYQPTDADPWIVDCYALNVGSNDVWICPYTDFPILNPRPGSPLRIWQNEIGGAHALAVRGNHVALLGGYPPDRRRITLLHLGDRRSEIIALGELDIGLEDIRHAPLCVGRGDTFHIVTGNIWHRLSMDELIT
jgi:hypothetical protein